MLVQLHVLQTAKIKKIAPKTGLYSLENDRKKCGGP